MKHLRLGSRFTIKTDFRVEGFDINLGIVHCVMYTPKVTDSGEIIDQVKFFLPLSFPGFMLGPAPYCTFLHPCTLDKAHEFFCTFVAEKDNKVYMPKSNLRGTLDIENLYINGEFTIIDESKEVHKFVSERGNPNMPGILMNTLARRGPSKLFQSNNYVGKALGYSVVSNTSPEEIQFVEEVVVNKFFIPTEDKPAKKTLLVLIKFSRYCEFFINYLLLE